MRKLASAEEVQERLNSFRIRVDMSTNRKGRTDVINSFIEAFLAFTILYSTS